MATLTVVIITTTHAFVLTVSHGLLFRQPLICADTGAAASLRRISLDFHRLGCEPLDKASI
jgi:hypothetical protein